MSCVYVVLGAGESGRLALVRWLVEHVVDAAEGPVSVHLAPEDRAEGAEALAWLEQRAGLTVQDWPQEGPAVDAGLAFVVTPGSAEVGDSMEAVKAWLEREGHWLGRILTVVDCTLLAEQPGARAFYEACIHFSDVVLLGNREGVSKKWVSDFQKRLEREALPARVELLKAGGKVEAGADLLYPEARRISLYFDEPEALGEETVEMQVPEMDEAEADAELEPPVDTYLERNEAGERVQRAWNPRGKRGRLTNGE